MKLDIIQNHYIIGHNRHNLGKFCKKYKVPPGNFVNAKQMCFHGAIDSNAVDNELSYDKFIQRYHEVYGNKPINKVINGIIQNNKELNHGWEKKVFYFLGMEEYLIAQFYKKKPLKNELPIKKYDIKYPKYNFSQFIAGNDYDIAIMKFISGIPNSVDQYFSIIPYICKHNFATKEMANEYYSKLKLQKNFPQDAYDDLAEQLKYLSENNILADSMNCNNLLVDANCQRFHIIDLPAANGAEKKVSERLGGAKQGAYDMISLLLDPRFQCYYLDQMSFLEKEETKNISKKIIEKCFISARKLSLSIKKDFIEEYFKFIQSLNVDWTENFSRRYVEFLELYKL